MSTKALLSSSALFMAALGLPATFMPQEIADYYASGDSRFAVLTIQVAGALYLGFAIVNWMARASLIGGIYNRPVAVGNFLHFTVVTLTLAKELGASPSAKIVGGAVIYAAFAVWFGLRAVPPAGRQISDGKMNADQPKLARVCDSYVNR